MPNPNPRPEPEANGSARGRSRRGTGDDPEQRGNVRLTGDRLVVRVDGDGERTSTGGLLIPATAAQAPRRLSWAEVRLVGPDVRVAERGDHVLFLPAAGLDVELEGEELVLLRERDVQGVSSSVRSERVHGQYL